jgi:uncharacterized protein YjbI with pentapeptide repeats
LRITWWHRGIVVADLTLIVLMTYRCFFPRGIWKAPLVLGALSRKPRWAAAMAFCILLAIFLAPAIRWLSFQEGRWAGEPAASSFEEWKGWMKGERPDVPGANPDYGATEEGVVFGLFPNRLTLNNATIVGGMRLEETKREIASRGGRFVPTLVLDGRDLQAATMSGADLRGVALRGAAMQGADLSLAHLEGAEIGSASVITLLQGAILGFAQLQGADLSLAQLQGADLSFAQLQGANLEHAQLQGAMLGLAQLQGADLSSAELQGANLQEAQLQGADLSSAELLGANLFQAELEGASLREAQLEGASLREAQLQSANLEYTQLQRADLHGADLADAELNGTFVFKTNIVDAKLATAMIESVRTDQEPANLDLDKVDDWIKDATQFVQREAKDEIVRRFARLKEDLQEANRDWQTAYHDESGIATWNRLKESDNQDDANTNHLQRLAKLLGDLACDGAGTPYVARGLVGVRAGLSDTTPRLAALGDQLDGVRRRLKDGRKNPEACPGVADFTEDDWRRLDAIKPVQTNPETK